jgi:hypothetical protein
MPPVIHQRLLNESTLLAVEAILQQMPAPYSPELERAIRRAVQHAVLHYAEGLDTLARQLYPLDHQSRKARA